MSDVPLAISLVLDEGDLAQFRRFLEGMGRRLAREQILPILKEHFGPVVAAEKAILAPHSKSGALEGSLAARSGAGDRPGTVSVFSAPTASAKALARAWSQGRSQQRRWAAGLAGKRGRRRVFYGPIVHQGHRIVRRKASGELYDTGKRTRPVPFASEAMAQVGEAQADAAAEAIMTHICGW